MASSGTCPRCNGRTEEGFGVDHGDHDARRAQGWHPGPPDKRWWGLKIDKAKLLPLVMMRCTRCGVVESYAR